VKLSKEIPNFRLAYLPEKMEILKKKKEKFQKLEEMKILTVFWVSFKKTWRHFF